MNCVNFLMQKPSSLTIDDNCTLDFCTKCSMNLCTKICSMNCGNFFMQNPSSSPSANILEEAEADGPMKSTQNQDHRSYTTKYITQILTIILGPIKSERKLSNIILNKNIFGNEFGHKFFGQETIVDGDDDAAFGGNVINGSKLPKAKKLLCPMHLQMYSCTMHCNALCSNTFESIYSAV